MIEMDRLEESKKGIFQRIIAGHPAFHLVYLVFYFLPWLSFTPGIQDVIVAVVAILLFLPLHFMGHASETPKSRIAIVGTLLICAATSAFIGGSGVFYIYALAMAAYQRPLSFSAMIVAAASVVYIGAAFYFQQPWIFVAFNMFMGVVVWMGCVIDAAARQRQADLLRMHELDKQQASIEERERIARDLHDLLGHTLTMVSLRADMAARLIDQDKNAARTEIEGIRDSARSALSDVRNAVGNMTASTVAIELANAKKACESAGIVFAVQGKPSEIAVEHQQTLAMMIREATTNIIRHSQAQQMNIAFCKEAGSYTIKIVDDGVGLATQAGRGLTGLRERFELIGGEFSWLNDNGTILSGRLPKTLGKAV